MHIIKENKCGENISPWNQRDVGYKNFPTFVLGISHPKILWPPTVGLPLSHQRRLGTYYGSRMENPNRAIILKKNRVIL